jgi:transcriptional regulator with XRE-family HTH domain
MYPNLKALREKHGLTQREAAALVKVHPNTWAQWERGEQNPSAQSALLIEMTIKFVPLPEIIAMNKPAPTKKRKPTPRNSPSEIDALFDFGIIDEDWAKFEREQKKFLKGLEFKLP